MKVAIVVLVAINLLLTAYMLCRWLYVPSAWAGQGDVADCRPHLYLSGTVEVRGAPGEIYVLQYRSLPELAAMLQTVQQDMEGKIRWMGHD